jgi:hypothetical protein
MAPRRDEAGKGGPRSCCCEEAKPGSVKRKKTYHTSKCQCKRIGLRHPNLKAQQGMVETTQAYTTVQKNLRPHHTKKIYVAGPTNGSNPNDEILTLGP